MHRKIRRYKIIFVSVSGEKFSFGTLALHPESIVPRILRRLNKKLGKEVVLEGNELFVEGKKVAELQSITKMAKGK